MHVLCSNVRCSTGKDGDNIWANRKQVCVDVMRAQDPAIICCQEVLEDQFADLSAGLPEFDSFGMADEPHSLDVVDVIFYRRGLFRRVSAGGHWLSQTPHIPGSKSWDSDCIRLCNWLRLVETASGKEFRVVNTHLDHISQLARENQARLINEDAAAYEAAYPQILTGDMNAIASNAAIVSFKAAGWADTYEAVHGQDTPGNSFHRFMGPAFPAQVGKIDWIFVRGAVRTLSARIVTDTINGRYPSDHYFVSADIAL
jgi:endonuclease/exonuclease/phosphatase family metal-dependent hydrolase